MEGGGNQEGGTVKRDRFTGRETGYKAVSSV